MDERRWLDEDEARAWRGYNRMRDLLDLHITRDLERDAALSMADYTMLVLLSEAPGHRMRSRELAARATWSRSRLSHQLRRMEQRGLLRREVPPNDAHAVDAVITDEGMGRIRAAAPTHVDSVRRHLIDHLDRDELRTLATVAERVVAHLRTVPHGPPG